jgi:hypothetical protein
LRVLIKHIQEELPKKGMRKEIAGELSEVVANNAYARSEGAHAYNEFITNLQSVLDNIMQMTSEDIEKMDHALDKWITGMQKKYFTEKLRTIEYYERAVRMMFVKLFAAYGTPEFKKKYGLIKQTTEELADTLKNKKD